MPDVSEMVPVGGSKHPPHQGYRCGAGTAQCSPPAVADTCPERSSQSRGVGCCSTSPDALLSCRRLAVSQYPTPTHHPVQRKDSGLHKRVVEIGDKEAVESPTRGTQGLAVHAEGQQRGLGAELHLTPTQPQLHPKPGCKSKWKSGRTPGSRQLLPTENGGKALFVGARAYSVVGHLNFEFQVHWERVVARGEMGAAAEAVIRADQTKSLTVFTDCMTLLQIITWWMRGDFTPGEKHWDILSTLLEGLCTRTEAGSQTLIVWVKAHVGDVGKEMADKAADRGCTSDDIKFDHPTHPFLIYAIDTDEQLSQHCWSNKVQKHSWEMTGTHTKDRLQRTGTPSHTMCV
eukprot:3113720-Rhodomonas_salina.1